MIAHGPFTVGELDSIRFNVMVAGSEGLGKTTFLRSFLEPYKVEEKYQDEKETCAEESKESQELQIISLQSGNVSIDVHFTDSPGFGMEVNNTTSINRVRQIVESRHYHWSQLEHPTLTRQVSLNRDNAFY